MESNYINKELFDRQLIYSMEVSSHSLPINFFGDTILYRDSLQRDYYYVKAKSDITYPELKINAQRSNLTINENDKYAWIKISDFELNLKEYDKKFESKDRLSFIDELYHFPFCILKNNRIYLVAQYSSDVSEKVTERILKIKNQYDRAVGLNAFTIESIGSNLITPIEFLKMLDIKIPVYELKFKTVEPDEKIKGRGLFKILSNDYKNNEVLMLDENGLKAIKFSDIEISKRFTRMFRVASGLFNINLGFILYNDINCTGEECLYTVIFEENLSSGIFSVLEKLTEEPINFQIENFVKLL